MKWLPSNEHRSPVRDAPPFLQPVEHGHRHRRARVAALRGCARPAGGLPGLPHFPPKAKRVIYLFQHGAPSQLDLFDYKPNLAKLRGTELPDSVRKGQRLTGMTAYQTKFPTAPSIFRFDRCGQSGA